MYVCTILLKVSTLPYQLFRDLSGVYSTLKLARVSSLGNAIFESQSPAYPSESEAKHAHFMLCQ